MGWPQRIEGYAIVSREGMIATADRVMPPGLKIDADQRFFHGSLEHATAVANGRHSNEGGPLAAARPRLVLTRSIPTIAAHPTNPNALLWNPAGSSFEEAWDRLKVDGVLAGVGGPDGVGQFLDFASGVSGRAGEDAGGVARRARHGPAGRAGARRGLPCHGHPMGPRLGGSGVARTQVRDCYFCGKCERWRSVFPASIRPICGARARPACAIPSSPRKRPPRSADRAARSNPP